jgi:hypothetical protein
MLRVPLVVGKRCNRGSTRHAGGPRGSSLGYVSAVNSLGFTIWIAEAHCADGNRFVVRADEKLTGFVELESAIRFSHSVGTWTSQPKQLLPRR